MSRNSWAYADMPSTPGVGDQWYDVNTSLLKIWSGTQWVGGLTESGGVVNGPLTVSPPGFPSTLEVRPNGWVVTGNGFQANGDIFGQNLISNGTILAAGNISGQDLFVRDITARNATFSGPVTLLTEAYKEAQAVTLGQVRRLIEEFYSGGADYAPLINPPNGQNNYAPLANPSFTGAASLNGDTIASQSWVNQYITNLNLSGIYAPLVNPANGQNNYAPINNPTFVGTVILPGDASSALSAVTLQQVQALIAAGGGVDGGAYLPLVAGSTNPLTGPLYLRNLGSGSIASSCIYFGTTTTPASQLAQGPDNGSLELAAGATTSPIGLWTARNQAITGIEMRANTVNFYSDGGLTIGATFSPTTVFRYNTNRVSFNVPIDIANLNAAPEPTVNGLMYYNSVTNELEFYSTGAWHTLWPAEGGPWLPVNNPAFGGTLSGSALNIYYSLMADSYAVQTNVPVLLNIGNATQPLQAVPLQQVQSLIAAGGDGGAYLPLAGGTVTGNLTVNGTTTITAPLVLFDSRPGVGWPSTAINLDGYSNTLVIDTNVQLRYGSLTTGQINAGNGWFNTTAGYPLQAGYSGSTMFTVDWLGIAIAGRVALPNWQIIEGGLGTANGLAFMTNTDAKVYASIDQITNTVFIGNGYVGNDTNLNVRGDVTLTRDATQALHAVPLQQVQALIAAGGGGGGIPEPSTVGSFLRTNAGTWVAGLPISAGTANSLTGPLQLVSAGSGTNSVLYFGSNTNISGSQISGNFDGTQLTIAVGATVTPAGSWTARAAYANSIQFQYAAMSIYANSGLIAGNVFVPTPRIVITADVTTFNMPIKLTSMGSAPTSGVGNGIMYYNTTTNTINVYINGAWKTINVT